MNIAFLCVLIAAVLPVVCAGIAKAGLRDYDNHDPRAWMTRLSGYRARANAAQANGFEAFPLFAAGVALASIAGVAPGRIDMLAVGFIAARIAYIACYLTDRATLRSLVWVIGHACAIALLVMAMLHG